VLAGEEGYAREFFEVLQGYEEVQDRLGAIDPDE